MSHKAAMQSQMIKSSATWHCTFKIRTGDVMCIFSSFANVGSV